MKLSKAAKKLLDDRNGLRADLAVAEYLLDEHRRDRRIICLCGKKNRIRDIDVLWPHSYDRDGNGNPHSEWQFLCLGCGLRNRILFDDWDVEYKERGRAWAVFNVLYRGLFKSRTDLYDTPSDSFYNNYHIDQNREYFELPPKPHTCQLLGAGRNPPANCGACKLKGV